MTKSFETAITRVATAQECKSILACFNIIFSLSGAALIVFGVWILMILVRTGLSPFSLRISLPWSMIILGLIVFIAVAMSMIPSSSPSCLFMYATWLFVFFALELILGVYTLQYNSAIKNHIDDTIHLNMYNYDGENQKYMDTIQKDFQCCGKAEPEDWVKIGKQIPPTCCKHNLCNPLNSDEIYGIGCFYVISFYLALRLIVMAILVIVISIIPLAGGVLLFFHAYGELSAYSRIP